MGEQMSAAWRRGLLRLWIVGAISWIGLAGYPEYKDLTRIGDLCEELDRKNRTSGQIQYDISRCRNQFEDQKVALVKHVFVPPVIALFIGMGLWWALKGFRGGAL
jgi:hypothetical protein